MKNKMRNSLLLLSQILIPMFVMAGPPVKYPNCAQANKIIPVGNASGIYFDETCTTAYVLPPAQGRLEIKGLAPNMNLKLCGAYESSLRVLANEYAHLELLSNQLERAQAPVDSSNDSGFGDTSLDGSKKSSGSIHTFQPIDPSIVPEIQKTLEMIDLTQKSLLMFNNDKKGVAVGQIKYFVNWDALIADYQKANPKMHFARLPLEAGRIVFSRKLGAAGDVVTGSVTQNIQGLENTSGISKDGTLSASSGSVIMGDAITGQIVLNFAGACPFIKNGQILADLSQTEIDAYLASNFQYKFSLQGLRKYTARFNLASIAKHIQESRSSGGFFSSSTSNSIIDTSTSSDEFNMEVSSDQESYEFADSLRAEVKTELVNRVISELASATGQSIELPTLAAPPPHGATVLSDGLQKVPNIYAQVGSVALKVLDSIFGNSDAVASYTREKNGVSVDKVSDRRMFIYNGSMVFTGAALK